MASKSPEDGSGNLFLLNTRQTVESGQSNVGVTVSLGQQISGRYFGLSLAVSPA
jgi:hypothetical protein